METKTNIIENYVSYRELRSKADKQLNLLNTIIGSYLNEAREFAYGEEVEVVRKSNDEVVGRAFVTSVKCMLYPTDYFLADNPMKSLEELRYELIKKRSDGTMGVNHFFGSYQHYIGRKECKYGDYYIRKV